MNRLIILSGMHNRCEFTNSELDYIKEGALHAHALSLAVASYPAMTGEYI